MLLDSFKLHQLIVQIMYPEALQLWDSAGRVNRRLQSIWPGTSTAEIRPNQQVLRSEKVQIDTGLVQSTVSCSQLTTIDQHTTQQLLNTFQAWRSDLELTQLTRVSSRVLYAKTFPTIAAANAELFSMGLCRMPRSKVFDQPTDSELNTFDVTYRFEDKESFALLRVRSEFVKLEFTPPSEFSTLQPVTEMKYRLILDFDRGVKGVVDATNFRMDEWLKGFIHILRRDIEKVIGKE